MSDLYLRKADMSDAELLFQWVNDPEVRKYSFDSHIISHEEHMAWYEKLMKDPDRLQFIFMSGEVPVGQIRLDLAEKEAEVGYSIAPSFRGKGYGREIISKAVEMIKDQYPSVVRIIARVMPENEVSAACFAKNGFSARFCQYELELGND